MNTYVLLVSVVIFSCVIVNRVSSRLGIPTLLAFILLGMFFGGDGVIKINFDNFKAAELICSSALIFIMFSSGFDTNWTAAKPVAIKAIVLSSFGVFITAALTGVFCHYALKFDVLESFLMGAVISSTDAASVFSILRARRLNLKYNTASMLEVESGSNDPFSYMLTIVALSMINGSTAGVGVAIMLVKQIVFGVAIGGVIAYFALKFLKSFNFATSGFDGIFLIGVALLSYGLPTSVGGNGYLSAYIVGIILGNGCIKKKAPLAATFDLVTGLMQILIFFLLGLLASPSTMPAVFVPSMLIAIFITFVARPVSVFAILGPTSAKLNQEIVVSWTGLRGAASIVFAIMAATHPAQLTHDIFHITFWIVLFSILIQGSLLPLISRKTNMIDNNIDVLKTFNDYAEETPVEFIKFSMEKEHPWVGEMVMNIVFPPETLLVLILRGNERISPNGNLIIEEGDKIILVAQGLTENTGIYLSELLIEKGSPYINNSLIDIKGPRDRIVVMIKRGEEVIIPDGKTVILEGDILVIGDNL